MGLRPLHAVRASSNRAPIHRTIQFETLEPRELLTAAAIVDGYTDKWSYVNGESIELY